MARADRLKGAKDEIKRPQGPPTRIQGLVGPKTSSIYLSKIRWRRDVGGSLCGEGRGGGRGGGRSSPQEEGDHHIIVILAVMILQYDHCVPECQT